MCSSDPIHVNLRLRLGTFSCPFVCTNDFGSAILTTLRALSPDRILLVTDQRVHNLHGTRVETALRTVCEVTRLEIAVGERAKSLQTVERLCEQAIAVDATRRSLVVALGGGVVGNTAGVLAGLLFRGIRLLHVPTTLLAACDSVISLKQAVNSTVCKNSFGLYLEPCGVLVDLTCMETLPAREIRSGLAELFKNVLAIAPDTSEALTDLVSRPRPWGHQTWMELIALGLEAKHRVMADDQFERATAIVLEYGHTVGHALEIVDAAHGDQHPISHGDSVEIGMRVAARVAQRLGHASTDFVQRHDSILQILGRSDYILREFDMSAVLGAIAHDNKRGRIALGHAECAMVVLEDFGRPVFSGDVPLVPVPIPIVREALLEVFGLFRKDQVSFPDGTT